LVSREARDVVLIDPLSPFAGKLRSDTHMLNPKVPRVAVKAGIGGAREMVAYFLELGGAEGSLTSSLLAITVAAAAGISVRYANAVLAREDPLDGVAHPCADLGIPGPSDDPDDCYGVGSLDGLRKEILRLSSYFTYISRRLLPYGF
jgi:hypothetical protein